MLTPGASSLAAAAGGCGTAAGAAGGEAPPSAEASEGGALAGSGGATNPMLVRGSRAQAGEVLLLATMRSAKALASSA